MARATPRRPLPALIFLLALSLLTALVWWRVINRANDDNKPTASGACPSASSAAVTSVPAPSAVTVTVLNSTDRSQLAATTTDTLKKYGFTVGLPANDSSGAAVAGVADIRYGPAGAAAATLLSYYFPGASLNAAQRTDDQVVVSLGTRFTAVATPSAVAQALAAKHISQPQAPRPGSLAQGATGSSALPPSRSGSSSASTRC